MEVSATSSVDIRGTYWEIPIRPSVSLCWETHDFGETLGVLAGIPDMSSGSRW